MKNEFKDLISSIKPLDQKAMLAAEDRHTMITKPPGSLGLLEKLAIQVAGIKRQKFPEIQKKAVIVMAADHGVVVEGVSAYPAEVTCQMIINMLKGGAAINVLSRQAGVRVVLVDMGVSCDLPEHQNLIKKKIRSGTNNITTGPAMSLEEALEAVMAGAHVANNEVIKGLDIMATGDMGIGNTTPSAAIAMAITHRQAREIVGRGTGVNKEGLERKISVVKQALKVNQPVSNDGLDILSKVGGFEIAGLTGAMLAAAANDCPIVIDGFISTAAAMIAVKLCPQVGDYLIAAHCSNEAGHHLMLDWLGLRPVLDLDLNLGEGTGAVLATMIVEASCRILKEMATFSEAGVTNKG